MSNAHNVWDKLAYKYDRLWVQKYSLAPTRNRIKQILINHYNNNEFKLLDLGCGTGQLLSELLDCNLNCRLIGADKSPEMIRMAKNRERDIEFVCLDIDNDDLTRHFTGAGLDVVVCCHSLPYYKNKSTVFKILYNILSPDGIAIFAQASVNNLYDKMVMRVVETTAEKAEYLSCKAFRALAEGFFDITEEFSIHERFFMPSICGFIMRKQK